MTIGSAEILERAVAWSVEGAKVALATVIETWGSSPRPRGSHLVVREDGAFVGSVSGGCVEGKVVEEARRILAGGGPSRVLEFGVSNEEAWEVGLACGGTVRILVQNAPIEALRAIGEASRASRAIVAFTTLEDGAVELWSPGDAALDEPRAQAASRALATDDAFVVEPWFAQAHNPALRLFIVGAVHIAEALVAIAKVAGYDVTVIDPREAFAKRATFEGVRVASDYPDEVLAESKLDHRTAIVTLTHDPKIDDPALDFALRSQAFYIGALGSGKTHKSRLDRLAKKGFDEAALARIEGPVGLKIGAKTPAEIAISIVAQMTERLRMGRRG